MSDGNQDSVGRSVGSGLPESAWASKQRTTAAVGTLVSQVALVVAIIGLEPAVDGYGFRLMAAIATVVLTICCGVHVWAWHSQLGVWRSGTDDGYPIRSGVSLVAHLVSYAAVLVGMYGTLEGSALAGWGSTAGTLGGIAFILIIFGQIIGGTQLLRRSGPPGTVPTYVRKLNSKVQSLR